MKPHKHAELIKQWADGATIESFVKGNGWTVVTNPLWNESYEYRIKPEEQKPVVRWLWATRNLQSNQFSVTDLFFTDEEAIKYLGNNCIKLEWSRTEFPE